MRITVFYSNRRPFVRIGTKEDIQLEIIHAMVEIDDDVVGFIVGVD